MASGFKSFSSIVSTTTMFICEKAIYKWEEEILCAPFTLFMDAFYAFKLSFVLCDSFLCLERFHDNAVYLLTYDGN